MADWPWLGSPYRNTSSSASSNYVSTSVPKCDAFLNSIHENYNTLASESNSRNQTLIVPKWIMCFSDPYVYQELGPVGRETFHQRLAHMLSSYGHFKNTFTKVVLAYGYNIGDEQASYYASSLIGNTTLKILDLSHTYITNVGAKYLADALESNTTLIELNLYQFSTRITDANILKRISDYLDRNKALQKKAETQNKKEYLHSQICCTFPRRISSQVSSEEIKDDKKYELKK